MIPVISFAVGILVGWLFNQQTIRELHRTNGSLQKVLASEWSALMSVLKLLKEEKIDLQNRLAARQNSELIKLQEASQKKSDDLPEDPPIQFGVGP